VELTEVELSAVLAVQAFETASWNISRHS